MATDDDWREAKRLLLAGLADDADAHDLVASTAHLHHKNNTFPGEVFMGLGADALDAAGVTRQIPIPYGDLGEKYLPECGFRGRDNHKIQFAILTCAAVRGGLEPDLLDEVIWWGSDDYWVFALYGAVTLIRASAEYKGTSVPGLVSQLANDHDVALT